MKTLYFLIPFFFLTIACSSTQKAKDASFEKKEIDESNLDLTQHLRKLPGLTIRGDGENASFVVRGVATVVSGNQPLFVLNGIAINDYATVYRMVDPINFKSARLLKNASETSFYGTRGANGVIIITTKS